MDIEEIYDDLFRFGAIISAPLWLPIVFFAFIPVKILGEIAKYMFSDYWLRYVFVL